MIEDKDDFKYIRHLKLRLETLLSEPDQYLESSDYITPLYD